MAAIKLLHINGILTLVEFFFHLNNLIFIKHFSLTFTTSPKHFSYNETHYQKKGRQQVRHECCAGCILFTTPSLPN